MVFHEVDFSNSLLYKLLSELAMTGRNAKSDRWQTSKTTTINYD